jgi:hypothetical protein
MTLLQGLFDEIISDVKDELELLFQYGNIGDDDTPVDTTDTALGNEVFRSAIIDFDKSATAEVVASMEVDASSANGETIREAGWNTESSSGTQLTRNVVNPITKTSDIVLYLDTSIVIEVKEV